MGSEDTRILVSSVVQDEAYKRLGIWLEGNEDFHNTVAYLYVFCNKRRCS